MTKSNNRKYSSVFKAVDIYKLAVIHLEMNPSIVKEDDAPDFHATIINYMRTSMRFHFRVAEPCRKDGTYAAVYRDIHYILHPGTNRVTFPFNRCRPFLAPRKGVCVSIYKL